MRIALTALVALLVSCSSGPKPSAKHPLLGKQVALTLATDGGEQVAIPGPDKKKIVLEFFGPKCESCSRRLPALVEQREAINAKGARLVLVALLGEDESADQARVALQNWGVLWPFLVDASGACRPHLRMTKPGGALILDGKGKLLWSAPEGATAADVVAAIR